MFIGSGLKWSILSFMIIFVSFEESSSTLVQSSVRQAILIFFLKLRWWESPWFYYSFEMVGAVARFAS